MLNIISITISFLGSMILAFSVEENPHGYQSLANGKKKHFALIDSKRFKLGVWLMVIGFGCQITVNICAL